MAMSHRSRSPHRHGKQQHHTDPFAVFESPAPHISETEALTLAQKYFGIAAQSASPLGSERDQNFHLRLQDGTSYVLKIANSKESLAETELQTQALDHVAAMDPTLPVPRTMPATDGSRHALVDAADGLQHVVRVITWLEGVLVRESLKQPTPGLRQNLGTALGRMGRALRGFFHPAAGRVIIWDVQHLNLLECLLVHLPAATVVASAKDPSVPSEERHKQVLEVMRTFRNAVKPRLSSLRAQVIWNDLNPDNVLMHPEDLQRVTGLFDFGDVVHAPVVCDVAVAASYVIVAKDGPEAAMKALCDFLHGYCTVTPLEDEEVQVLLNLVRARYATTVLITSWRASVHPDNRDYLFLNTQFAWDALATLACVDDEEALHLFQRACGLPVFRKKDGMEHAGDEEAILCAMATRRVQALGPAYRLFYDKPALITSASGVRLKDPFGQEYLDAYNNVPCVGHCHPAVVSAVTSQMRTLNTHTRYLHHDILQLSEQLAATMPRKPGSEQQDRLSVVMLVNSGSEAVDLALRLAEACTGGRGVVVTQNAYHGCTTATSQVSPLYAVVDAHGHVLPTEPHVRLVPAPDFYGGAHRLANNAESADGLGTKYADYVKHAGESLINAGMGPPTLLICPSFASDGIFLPGEDNARLGGYLRKAVDHVREAGGVFIADEVQSGYARVGSHFWSFDAHGVMPDIVTVGKPMGNGYPVAAVVTTPAVAKAFADRTRFFSTFAGGPVACAAALTVLEVMKREKLQEKAHSVGNYGLRCFQELRKKHPLIGDIRGSGLFWGIELVKDHTTREPATDETVAVVNGLRERGVLVSSTGRNNVLKCRPPMQFSKLDVDRLAAALNSELSDVAVGVKRTPKMSMPGTMTNV